MTSDGRQSENDKALTRGRLAQDFSLILARTIESVKSDPAQFRNLIYEMARAQLQKEAWHRNPPMNILELRRMMLALETAIERVETDAAMRDGMPLLEAVAPRSAVNTAPAPAITVHAPSIVIDQTVAQNSRPVAGTSVKRARAVPAPLKAVLRLVVVAAVAAAIVLVLDRQFHLLSGPRPVAVDTPASPPAAAAASVANIPAPLPAPAAPASAPTAIASTLPKPQPAPQPAHSGPVPAVYGVYAVSDEKLFELKPLIGRVPDQRVFMSPVLNKPSSTVLPNGHVTFIVYRRDIVSSAPDAVTVRVIARIARELKFNEAGKPSTVKVDDAWAIRNISFDYRVAPSPDNQEMIAITPQDGQFALPPGRYGLVIKGLAYDFTVDGRVTAVAQCLERTQAANGTFYSECRAL